MKNHLKVLCAATLWLLLPSISFAGSYVINFAVMRMGGQPGIRQEAVYQVDDAGKKTLVQGRYFNEANGELRQAQILDEKGAWHTYFAQEVTADIKEKVAKIDGSPNIKRVEVKLQDLPIIESTSTAPRKSGQPALKR